MGKCRYDLSEDCHNKNCLACALNKIRAEIGELDGKYVIGDYAVYGESSHKYVRLWEVLQIIDKYKAESWDRE